VIPNAVKHLMKDSRFDLTRAKSFLDLNGIVIPDDAVQFLSGGLPSRLLHYSNLVLVIADMNRFGEPFEDGFRQSSPLVEVLNKGNGLVFYYTCFLAQVFFMESHDTAFKIAAAAGSIGRI
jgi:hypothetical protein